jgi:hypothetical protein
MADDDTPIDVGVLEEWLRHVADRLSAALEESALYGNQLDHLIGLLMSLGTAPAHIAMMVPENVAESRRKLLGPARTPGLLDTRGGHAPATPKGTHGRVGTSGGVFVSVVGAARARMQSDNQGAVLGHVLSQADSHADEVMSPQGLADALHGAGSEVHVETVRKNLQLLEEIGLLQRVGRGFYTLSSTAKAELNAKAPGS